MVERVDSQGTPVQPQSSEPQLIIETRKYTDLFIPSPLEEAFDAEIQRRFHTALLEPGVDEYGCLIRVSYPAAIGDSLVAFQYTRYDLLKQEEEAVIKDLLPHNPSISKSLGNVEILGDVYGENWLENIENVMVLEGKFIKAIRQRIVERDGAIDPRRAVSDSSYYTEGDEVEQWPESFKFAIFDRSNMFAYHVSPSQIERNGKLAGRRASIYGALSIPVYFRDEAHPFKEREVQLIVSFPQLDYETARAYLQAFEGKNPEDYKRGGLDVDDYSTFGLRSKIKIPLRVSQSPKNI